MKTKKLKILCALGLALLSISPAYAHDDGAAVVVDVVLVRPVCLAATIIGCAFFVISLPFAATSHSIHETADALVCEPFEATFTRPMGDFDDL